MAVRGVSRGEGRPRSWPEIVTDICSNHERFIMTVVTDIDKERESRTFLQVLVFRSEWSPWDPKWQSNAIGIWARTCPEISRVLFQILTLARANQIAWWIPIPTRTRAATRLGCPCNYRSEHWEIFLLSRGQGVLLELTIALSSTH